MAGEKIEEHRLVVALEKDGIRKFPAEIDQVVENSPGVRPAVDVVAKKHHLVRFGWCDPCHQSLEVVATAVDVADGQQTALLRCLFCRCHVQ